MIKPVLIFDKNKNSINIKKSIEKKIKFYSLKKSNLIIVIGGDGFMLQSLKKLYKQKKPFYGINSGDYGFLMNRFSQKNLVKNLLKNNKISVPALEMKVINKFNIQKKAIAINEVSILRQSRQTS